jgi:hypothetical protein
MAFSSHLITSYSRANEAVALFAPILLLFLRGFQRYEPGGLVFLDLVGCSAVLATHYLALDGVVGNRKRSIAFLAVRQWLTLDSFDRSTTDYI